MADYWKSIPKYWCKNCSTYVADTKLGRANHEATGKHQGAVRRALRDLHRNHERQEREQEKARREVARLNGLVGGPEEGGAGGERKQLEKDTKPRPAVRPPPRPTAAATAAPRDQLEQLADLGVSIPDAFRGELAMAGDWTVTATRVVDNSSQGAADRAAARAVGVRKRLRSDDGDDGGHGDDGDDGAEGASLLTDVGHADEKTRSLNMDAAVQGLFKRPRHWGRVDARAGPGAEGDDLDNLLSGTLLQPVKKKQEEVEAMVKGEATADAQTRVKSEEAADTKQEEDDTRRRKLEQARVKTEVGDDAAEAPQLPPAEAPSPPAKVKQEDDERGGDEQTAANKDIATVPPIPHGAGQGDNRAPPPAESVLFKKRKTKTVRHK
ncbi:formin-binding protein [Niveomyces insectorum RCEF 264]|uniref:Formin-binding protein n=1 Tax=Niveomyces insectorum RCEF 264 TaxID=1081102 RepID=A0A167UPU4_9HYPO|nr:formin-binding protein [Niveomyces insectorum RCEF 264]